MNAPSLPTNLPRLITIIIPTRAAIFLSLFLGFSACADTLTNKTWTDGIYTYEDSPLLDGYYVPTTAFKNGVIPLNKVLAMSRRMTPAELNGYVQGKDQQVSREYPLFVFKNHGMNAFLWKGKTDGQQQILPLAWDGEFWLPKSYAMGRTNAVEHLFYHPGEDDRCYVMVYQSNGQRGRNRIHTDRVFFGAFPSSDTLIRKSIENAHTVVYRPFAGLEPKSELMDCVKGNVTASDFRKLLTAEKFNYNTLVFIDKTANGRKIRSAYEAGKFWGVYGKLFVEQRRVGLEQDKSLKEFWSGLVNGNLRWNLGRDAFEGQQIDASCRLRMVNSEVQRGEWVILELVVGGKQPGVLYRRPQRASQRDGGDALFEFRILQGSTEVVLAPNTRFNAPTTQEMLSGRPRQNEALAIEYQFIDCGPGVVKLALRPTEYPWKAAIRATFNSNYKSVSLGLNLE